MSFDPRVAPASILLVGTGVVGGALLSILESARKPKGVVLAGVVNRRGNVFGRHKRVDPAEVDVLRARPTRGDAEPVCDALLDELATLPRPVLVDATAADGIETLYARALERGIHVVTANKKPLVCKHATRAELFATAARTQAQFRYEATVGAGLPVIETLKDLVRTGDRVRRIDAVLSGTLGFLCNELRIGTPLSRALGVARDRGYTEPDPREDLGGADVARKAVILAREVGAALEIADVDLEPFISRDVLARSSGDDIEANLLPLDAEFARQSERLKSRGERLAFLARIEVDKDGAVKASAGPSAVKADHPAASLRGTSALVAFTTDRYDKEPLVVQGSGAGGAVTAAALLADVLKATGHA